MTRSLTARLLTSALLAATCCVALTRTASAQNRGVYPLGMSATNSGVTPEPGFAYVNQLLIYSRDKSKGPDGEVLGTGSNSVVMDMNTLAWVSKKKILGGEVLDDGHNPDCQKLAYVRCHRAGQRRGRPCRFLLSTIHFGLE